MIAGRLEHWRRYFDGPVWEAVFTHVQSLGPDAPEGYIHLMGEDVVARVMSYETVGPEYSKLEAHLDFVDVQCSLENGERIDWFPTEELEPINDYNPAKDVRHYRRPGAAPLSFCGTPGTFAVLFAEDAHMPKLVIDQPRLCKKVVVKVRASLVQA